MSAAVNDRPHDVLSSRAHLPLTGEFHPLRREFERLLATGNIVALTFAMLACTVVYFWPREAVEEIQIVREPRVIDYFPPVDPTGKNDVNFNDTPPPSAQNGTFVPGETDSSLLQATLPGQGVYGDKGMPGGDPFEGWQTGDSIVVPTRPVPEPQVHNWWDEAPVILSCDPPVYPAIVRDAGIDGTVNVRVLIGVNGRVKDAQVVDGPVALRDAALASARTAVFKPALQGVHPVEVWVVIPITFQLHGGSR